MDIDKRGVKMYKTIALKNKYEDDFCEIKGQRYYWPASSLWPQEIKFAEFVEKSTKNEKTAAKIILDNPDKQDICEIINNLQQYLKEAHK